MQNHREKSPAGIIAISAISTLLILGGLTYAFFTYGLPMLPFPVETLYSILLRLLPIIIGLILVLIALAIRPPVIPKDTDSSDELEKDIYSSPLYNLPDEHEPIIVGRQQLPVSASLKESPAKDSDIDPSLANRVAEHTPEVRPFEGTLPSYGEEHRDTVVFEPYDSVISEPRLEEVELVEPEEAEEQLETDVIHSLGRAVLFSEYPYPIEPGSQIAELLAPIEETFEDGSLLQEDFATIEDNFETRLAHELESAKNLGYDVSLAIIELPHSDTDRHSVDATIVQNLFNRLGVVSFFYLTEEHRVSAILPFHGFEQSRRYFASLLESLRKQHPESTIKIGYSSSRNRDIDAAVILDEAQVAVDLASERSGFSLIGYDTDLESDED